MSRSGAPRRLAEAVAAIYAAAPSPSLWPEALQVISSLFDDVGANLFYIRDDGSFGMVVTPSMIELQKAYDAGWWRQDIRTQRAIEYGYAEGVEAITDRHIASEEEIAEHPFYRDFARPKGFGWFVGVPISPDSRTVLAMSIHRSAKLKPPFSDEELATFTWLGRHAENALRLSARLLTAELTNLAFGDALNRLEAGVFVLDFSGRVLSANAAAEGLTDEAFIDAQGCLMARLEPERSELRRAIETAIAAEGVTPHAAARPVVLHGIGMDTYAVAYVLPVRSPQHHVFDRALVDARAMVVVRKASRGEPLDPSLVRDLLDVTLGEARVAALVGSGIQPREAALQLGIAEETARTVLKRVFAKTGVSRQTDLTALLTRLVLR